MSRLAVAVLVLAGCYVQQPLPPNPPPRPQTVPASSSDPSSATQDSEGDDTREVRADVGEVETDTSGPVYDLRYDWHVGDVQRFRYAETADVRASMGMAGDFAVRIGVASELDMRVSDVDDDGWAHVTLELRSFAVSANGRELLTLRAIPPRARSVEAWISPRGEVVFADNVLIVVGESTLKVVVAGEHRADRASASVGASARIGDQEVTVAASVDVQTGAVRGEARLTSRERVVRVRDSDTTLDVLPRDLLQMIVLPAGPVAVGGGVVVTTPLGNARVTVEEIDDGRLAYDTSIRGEVSGVQSVAADIRTTVTADANAAWLTSVEGHVDVEMNAGGMEQRVRRSFRLTRVD